MIKSLPFASGYLTHKLGQYDTTAEVDNWLYGYLAANLYSGYSYLKIRSKCSIEVVKVVNIQNGLLYLERAQEHTKQSPFQENASVEYCLTVAEIKQYAGVHPVYVWPVWPVKLDESGISYESVGFTTKGSSEVVINGNVITIAHDFGAYGCCDCQPLFAAISNKDYYLTSMPYPIDITEWTLTTAMLGLGIRLQPFWMDSLETVADLTDISIYGQAQSFNELDWMQTNVVLADISIYGNGKAFKTPPDNWVQAHGELVDISIYGAGVSYTILPDWTKTTAELVEIVIYV